MPFLLCLELQRHLPISVILILMNLMFQAFIATGFNLILTFDPTPAFNPAHRHVDYEKEPGKVRTLNLLNKSPLLEVNRKLQSVSAFKKTANNLTHSSIVLRGLKV